jgi:hypothetical protein
MLHIITQYKRLIFSLKALLVEEMSSSENTDISLKQDSEFKIHKDFILNFNVSKDSKNPDKVIILQKKLNILNIKGEN